MRIRFLGLLTACFMSVLAVGEGAAASTAKGIYVAPWGKDSWSGSKARPYETLHRAQREVRSRTRKMRSDIVVNLLDGTHTLSAPLHLSSALGDSGRNGHRVIYQAADFGKHRQARPVVSGGRQIDRWRLDPRSPNVWRTDVGRLELRQLFVNGVRARRASLGGGLTGDITTTESGLVVESQTPQSWQRAEDIEFIRTPAGDYRFSEARCGVASISGDGTSSTITMDQPCWDRARALYSVPADTSAAARGLDPKEIENSRSFLDAPGEFYLDRSLPGRHVLYYIPRAGEDMRRADVVAPVLEALVTGTGAEGRPLEDVTLRGLTFSHGTWLAPNTPTGFPHEFASLYQAGLLSDDPLDQGGIMSPTNSLVPASVSFDHAEGIVLERNKFTRLGGDALLLARGRSNLVVGNEFTDLSSSAIVLNAPRIPSGQRGDVSPLDPDQVADGNQVVNNWIHGIGVEYRGGVGMLVLASRNTTIAHNQINDVPHNGIAVLGDDPPELDPPKLVDSTEHLRIENNRIFDTTTVLDDGAGIYSAGEMGTSFDTGSEISGNYVSDQGPSQKLQIGIYTDWLTNWATVRENVIHGVTFSTGGCIYYYIRNIQFTKNHWQGSGPTWLCNFGVLENITLVRQHAADGRSESGVRCRPSLRGDHRSGGARARLPTTPRRWLTG